MKLQKQLLTDFDVIVVVVYVCLLSAALAGVFSGEHGAFLTGSLSLFLGGDQIVDLDVALLNCLLLKPFFLLSVLVAVLVALFGSFRFSFLLVCVLVVDSIVEVLVVEFLVVPVQLSDARVESYHHVLILHEAGSHLDDFVRSLVSCLGVERTKDDTAGRIIFHQAVLVRLQAAFGELGIQIIRSPRRLVSWQLRRLVRALDCPLPKFLLLLLEVAELLLL